MNTHPCVLTKKLFLTGLKLAIMIGALTYFLLSIISTYAHIIFVEEESARFDFIDGIFNGTGLNFAADSVQLVPIGLSGDQWLEETNGLPEPLGELAAVIGPGGKVFVIGGYTGSECRNKVYSSTIDITAPLTKSISPWVAQTSLPEKLSGMAAVLYSHSNFTSTIFVLGGIPDCAGNPTDKVYQATISNDTGAILTGWTTTTPLPETLQYLSAVEYDGKIYVIGGEHLEWPNDYVSDVVYYAPILPNGELGSWTEAEQTLPQGFMAGVALVHQGDISDTIYVIGGADYASTGVYTSSHRVLYTDILNDGSILTWTESVNGGLPFPLNSHSGVMVNNVVIWLTGGRTGVFTDTQSVSSTVKAVNVDEEDPDRIFNWCEGQVGDCNRWQTGPLLPRKLSRAATVQYKGHIYVLGGFPATEGAALDTVYHGDTTGGMIEPKYAPKGSYTSNAIALGQPSQLKALVWQANIPNTEKMTLTMEYRYGTSESKLADAPWAAAPPNQMAGIGGATYIFTYTFPTNITNTTRYFQYNADLSTKIYTRTPGLERVTVYYDVPPPDVEVSKEADESEYWPGDIVTYHIYCTATGGVPAQGVVVTETVPENTAYVETGYGWQQVGSSSTYTYYVGNFGITGTQEAHLQPPFSVQITTSPGPELKSITDVVRIGYPPMTDALGGITTDPTPTNTFTLPLTVKQIFWDIYKGAQPPPGSEVKPAETITYTITYTNAGWTPEDPGTSIIDYFDPDYLEEVTSTSGSEVTLGDGVITVTMNYTIAPHTPETVTITAKLKKPLDDDEVFSDKARIESEHGRPKESKFITHVVDSSPVLTITKSAAPPPRSQVNIGKTILYTITYTNSGDMKAYNVVITDTVSEYLEDIKPSPLGVWAGNIITWTNLPTLTVTPLPGSSQVVTFTARVKLDAGDQIITNTAAIAALKAISQRSEPITHVVPLGPILNIHKDDGYTPPDKEVYPGQTLTYTIRYTNTGGMTATNLALTDTIPLSTTYQPGGSNWTQIGSRVFTLSVPDLGIDKSGVATMIVRVADNAPGMWITNTVEIGGTDPEGHPAVPNEAIDQDLIHGAPDLSIQKDDGWNYVSGGQTLTYTISYINSGNLPATGIVITEIIPENTDCIDGCPGWNLVINRTYTRTVPNLPISGSGATSIKVRVKPDAPRGLITNTVEIAASGERPEENLTDNTDWDVDRVRAPELIIEKNDDRTNIEPGEVLIYTINYGNDIIGDATATNVIITETMPLSTTYVGYGWFPIEIGGRTCYTRAVPNLRPGQHMTTEIKAKVDYGAPPGPMTNTVQIGASYGSPVSATDVTTVSELSKLLIYKNDGLGAVQQGHSVTYTIIYTNAGNTGLNNVVITDTIPDGTSKKPGGSPWQGSNPYTLPPFGLGPGDSGTATMIVTVTLNAPLGNMTNTVEIAGMGPSGIVTDFTWDVDYVVTPTAPLYDLYIVNLATNPLTPTVDQGTDFTVRVKNIGTGTILPSAAEGEIVVGTFRMPIAEAIRATEAITHCWIGLYIDPSNPPEKPYDYNYNYLGIIYLPLKPGQEGQVIWHDQARGTWGSLAYPFKFPGWHTVYAQADVYVDNKKCNPYYGCVPESDETNNIVNRAIWVKHAERIHLPIILKNR